MNNSFEDHSTTFYFLSDDYSAQILLQKKISNLRGLGSLFHKSISEDIGVYQLFFNKIVMSNNQDFFWSLPIATHSSAETPLLKHLIYLNCAKKLISSTDIQIGFVCETDEIAKVLREEAKKMGITWEYASSRREVLESPKILSRLIYRSFYFLLRSLILWMSIRRFKNLRLIKNSDQDLYILRSWLTPASVIHASNYKDRNFGPLLDYLKAQSKEVWILPLFFNTDKHILKYLKSLSEMSAKIIFFEQYIGLMSYFKMLFKSIRSLFINLKVLEFQGMEVGSVIRKIHYGSALAPELLNYNMTYELLSSLSKKKINVHRFIYTFENTTNEKTFLIAIKKFYPKALSLGFQHSVWYKEQISMRLFPQEMHQHPLPDQIICSGARYPSILSSLGFPENKLGKGANLRFAAIHEYGADEAICPNRELLIILNYDYNQCTELLTKVQLSLKMITPCTIKIKSHPLLNQSKINTFLGQISFAPYVWVEGAVQEHIQRSNAVIMGGASVTNYEVIVLGVPLVRISLDSNFDFDPLWEDENACPMLSEPRDIANSLENAFNLTALEKKKLISWGRHILENYFEPVTTETMDVFIR